MRPTSKTNEPVVLANGMRTWSKARGKSLFCTAADALNLIDVVCVPLMVGDLISASPKSENCTTRLFERTILRTLKNGIYEFDVSTTSRPHAMPKSPQPRFRIPNALQGIHYSFAHMHEKGLRHALATNPTLRNWLLPVRGSYMCGPCNEGKPTHASHKTTPRAFAPLDKVSVDAAGPLHATLIPTIFDCHCQRRQRLHKRSTYENQARCQPGFSAVDKRNPSSNQSASETARRRQSG